MSLWEWLGLVWVVSAIATAGYGTTEDWRLIKSRAYDWGDLVYMLIMAALGPLFWVLCIVWLIREYLEERG